MRSERAQLFLGYVAANVRETRDRWGLTQEELAEKAGIERRYLQSIEGGTVNLSLGILVALAEALEVDPTDLLKPATLPEVRRGRPPGKRGKKTDQKR